MMYLVNFTGEVVVNEDDEESAKIYVTDNLAELVPMGTYEVTSVKELDF